MVDQVIMTGCDAEDALAQQVGKRMTDRIGEAKIREAACETLTEPDALVGRRQQGMAM